MNHEHKLRFKRALREYAKVRGIEPDRYWSAMLLLVTTTTSLWEKVQPHLEMKLGNAWLDQVEKQEYLSSGEAGLLSLARNLYNQAVPVDIAALADTLDEDNWPLVLQALALYRDESTGI